MSNASLKEQLQAVAGQLSDTVGKSVQKSARQNTKHAEKPRNNTANNNQHSKKPKPKWLDYAQYGVELLRAYFPACFKATTEIKPLKKGIKEDLVKRLSTLDNIVTDDKACMVKSLAYYVNTAAYHKSVVEGATRIDLDGNPAGLVTNEEAKYSVERHHAKLQAKQTTAAPTAQTKSKEEVSHV